MALLFDSFQIRASLFFLFSRLVMNVFTYLFLRRYVTPKGKNGGQPRKTEKAREKSVSIRQRWTISGWSKRIDSQHNERATFYSWYSYKVQLHVCNLRFAARAAIRSVTWTAKRSYPRRASAILVLSFAWKLKWRNGFLMYHVERKKLEDYSELRFLVFLFSKQEWKLKIVFNKEHTWNVTSDLER